MSGFAFNFDVGQAIRFTATFWKAVGTFIENTIRSDAKQGIFQTDEPHKSTYSQKYAELKKNGMKEAVGKTKRGKTVYKKVEKNVGVSQSSYNTSFVDMTLTGQTLRGLKIKTITKNGVTLSYDQKDIDKIVTNQVPRLNRRLVGLRKVNQNKVTEMVSQVIADGLNPVTGKEIINIKM